MSTLSIRLERVKETPGHFRLVADPAWWEAAQGVLDEPGVVLREPFELDFEAYRLGLRLIFRGRAYGALGMPCGRCGAPFEKRFDEPVEFLLEPAPASRAVSITGGLELDAEQGGVGHYTGEEIDLAPILLETLVLNWPMQPLCREACRGLCPRCGTNRNLGTCNCEVGKDSRPFSGLARLLKGSGTNPD